MNISDSGFVTIQGWMRTELNLTGNDLLVYAIIFGLSQDGESEFFGSQEYLAEWCGCTTRGIRKNIDSLMEKGLIKVLSRPMGKTVHYKALRHPIKEIGTKFQGDRKIVPRGVELSSDNNIEYSKEYNNTIPKGIVRENPTTEETSSDNVSDYERHMYTDEKPKKKSRWDKCAEMVDEYTDDEELRGALKSYLSDRLAMRDKPIYPNQWKALLKKLTAIGGNTKAVVQQSIEYGYASFYPLHNKNRVTSTPLSNFGESEVNQTVKVTKEQREAMLRNGEVY